MFLQKDSETNGAELWLTGRPRLGERIAEKIDDVCVYLLIVVMVLAVCVAGIACLIELELRDNCRRLWRRGGWDVLKKRRG